MSNEQNVRKRGTLYWLAILWGMAWLAAVAAICLSRSYGPAPEGFWGEWIPEYQGFAGFLLNIILFLPGGAAVGVLTRSVWAGLAVSLGLSAGIEILQLWIPGRHSSGGDIVANTLGGGIGALILVHRETLVFPAPKTSRLLALLWLALVLLALGLFGPLMRPAAPEVTLYSGWTPELRSLELYDGRVIAARIGNLDLPDGGPIAEDEQSHLRDLIRDRAPVEVTFLAGTRPSSLAPIVRVAGSSGNETLLVGADRGDLVVRRRFRADDFRLARPDLRVRGAHAALLPGDTVNLQVIREPGGRDQVTVNGVTRIFEVTPGRGWSFLRYPSARSEAVLSALDMTYLAGLSLPLGWWAPTGVFLGLSVGGIVGFYLLILPMAGLLGGNALQGIAIAAAAALGWLAGRVVRHLRRQSIAT